MKKKCLIVLLTSALFTQAWSQHHSLQSNEVQKELAAYFQAHLYKLAIERLKDLIIDSKDRDYLVYQLAKAYFLNHEFENVIKLSLVNPHLEHEPFFLLVKSLSYQRLKNFQSAHELFKEYLNLPSPPFKEQMQCEWGLCLFSLKEYAKAQEVLQQVTQEEIINIAQLYLAQIELNQNQFEQAYQRLESLHLSNDPSSFNFSYYFLKGKAALACQLYLEAIENFDKCLLLKKVDNNLSYLALTISYLKKAQESHDSYYLKKAKESVEHITALETEVSFFLAETALVEKQLFPDLSQEAQMKQVLQQCAKTPSSYLKAQTLLIELQAFPEQFELSLEENSIFQESPALIKAQCQAIMGRHLIKKYIEANDQKALPQAIAYFQNAHLNVKDLDPTFASEVFESYVTALAHLPEEKLHAITLVEEALKPQPYLSSHNLVILLSQLYAEQSLRHPEYLKKLTDLLHTCSNASFSLQVQLAIYKARATALFYLQDYAQAEAEFIQIAEKTEDNHVAAESLFWAAVSAEKGPSLSDRPRTYRKKIFENYVTSPLAAEAYFRLYPYTDYLQGDRTAIKHLGLFFNKFPLSPLNLDVHYLLGLDFKRDRKTENGKWIRKKSLTEAIEAFRRVEELFEEFYAKGLFKASELKTYIQLRYRAQLERALINLAIADAAQGAKKQIYLEYAQTELETLVNELCNKDHKLVKLVDYSSTLQPLEEEARYGLAQCYLKSQRESQACLLLQQIITSYEQKALKKGYYLAKAWIDLGALAMQKQHWQQALENFQYAEEAAKPKILSTDQRLSLWIEQGTAYRKLKQLDQALLTLSKAVNDVAVSPLRLKAMYLRGEIYEEQHRLELARKQFEAVAKKNGEWAQKAKIKLEGLYDD